MKEKSFYVINLDNKRLFIVTSGLLLIFLSFFVIGYRQGIKQNNKKNFISSILPGSDNALQKKDIKSIEKSPMQKGNEKDLLAKNSNSSSNDTYQTIDLSKQKKVVMQDSSPGSSYSDTYKKSKKQSKYKSKPKTSSSSKKKGYSKSSKGKYTIQIAAFKTIKKAKIVIKDLKKAKVPAYISKGKLYFFVRSGKAKNKNALKSRMNKIKAKTPYIPFITKSS